MLQWLLEEWARLAGTHGTRVRGRRLALTRRGWLLLSRLLERLLADVEALQVDRPDWPDGRAEGLRAFAPSMAPKGPDHPRSLT